MPRAAASVPANPAVGLRGGYATDEYVIFGGEWWLYVLSRIAEQPHRVVTVLADLNQGFS